MEREGVKEGGVLDNEERESWRKGRGEEGREGEEMMVRRREREEKA